MLLDDYSRYVIECELELGKIPKDAPDMPLRQCLPFFISLIDSGKAVYPFNNDRSVLRIVGYDASQKDALTLLFQLSDSDASDPAFAELATGKSRVVQKEDGEGVAATAHLVIALDPINKSFPDTYAAIFEEVPGITRTLISAGMTSFMAAAVSMEFERQNGSKKSTVKCRPSILLVPLSGQSLSECLKDGWLLGFTVVQKSKNALLDEDGDLTLEETRLIIKTPKSRSQRAMDLVKKAVEFVQKKEYTGLRLMYEDGDKRRKGIQLDSSRSDYLASSFVKTEYVNLGDKIFLCQDSIHSELEGKMLTILRKR
ncbi:hypothetical protein H9X88_24305 [Aeromonas hydrophila]|uniref:hypothetical protein n=1 Tax=Aeromonas hydrophila TaxID=644 RepID=UPI001B3A26D2|nr:hypothetical protein [Aeromonas hydrophila]MBQ4676136.1 hypothetical protein [Aeromonas hydrophila]MBW3814105.1 hypothetical protein [Aeromonas hydrophila]MCF7681196.1 hypothetical protein [Aeromonas hydrophila]MCF7694104.1 hypothetical protein [Aeromonas hydrophila]MCF7774975.1 hypothetical protein [Aeromonas hydrophila]